MKKHANIFSGELKAPKNYTPSIWTRADALKIHEDDPTTTTPLIDPNFNLMSETLFVWDTMPLRNLYNEVVSVNGWNVIFALAAERRPNDPALKDEKGQYDIKKDWEDRHGRARIHFWFAKDGKSWSYGGLVMKPGASPTEREWSGTPVLLDNKGNVDLYYTAVTPGATICKTKGKLVADENGVSVIGFDKVKSLFDADGKYYQTEEQNPYWGFRDPSPYIDPKSGKLFMVFEGNVAGVRGSHVVTDKDKGLVPPGHEDTGGSNYQTACIGIAVATDRTGDHWKLLPPLVTAVGVNDQTERPHFVFHNGLYYLFTISHKFTFGDGVTGPDGVYGFLSNNLFGPYKPMNSSGLVLGNPSKAPYQAYSHYVYKYNGNECLVTSFIDSIPEPVVVNDLEYRIGGTEAPTVGITLQGNKTYVTSMNDYGYIPAVRDVKIN